MSVPPVTFAAIEFIPSVFTDTPSVLNTTAHVVHRTPFPSTVKESDAISLLHDHGFIISLDPHLSQYNEIPLKEASQPLPSNIDPNAETKCYQVTDIMHNLPAGLWDSNIESTVHYTNLEKGVFVRMQSPLSINLKTEWKVATQDDGTLELLIECTIACSRLLVGIVRGQSEANQPEMCRKLIEKLVGEKEPQP